LATGGASSMGTPRVPSGCQPNWFVYAFSWVRSPHRRVDLDTISSSVWTYGNLSGWEHGSWDLSLHTRSQVTWCQSMQSQPLRAWKLGLTTSHGVPSIKSQVTWCQFVQSQPLRTWRLGFTPSHMVSSLKCFANWNDP
jgi:hypothetical protein